MENTERKFAPIKFTFITSPMRDSLTESEAKIRDRVNNDADIIAAAIEASNQLKEAISKIEAGEGYYGTAVLAEISKIPRYAYIKNAGDGWDAEIDVLEHTISRIYND